LLITGVDPSGRSCLVSVGEITTVPVEEVPGASVAKLFATHQSPPPPCQPGLGRPVEDRLAPGLVQWYVVNHAPSEHARDTPATELHHRNAIDLIVVMEGSGALVLGDGEHAVRAGDCVVMPGTDHGLRPDPAGCRLLSFAIGTAPAEVSPTGR
jgi:mannose-6-phosphate isomerase-like protein (cupin superfamily)